MGELSPSIGKKLEGFGNLLFSSLHWDVLAQDITLDCSRSTHKSPTSQSGKKMTHGIDLLQGYYNPFTKRKEAIIIEYKNHQWSDFIPSNLNMWLEELLNTFECAISSPEVQRYLGEYVLTSGMLLFNSSDDKYSVKRAEDNLSKIKAPRRRTPITLYLADTDKLEQIFALNKEISYITKTSVENKFGIIYPSVGGSKWLKNPVIIPSYLMSDYILGGYIEKVESHSIVQTIEVKTVFSFDNIGKDSFLYLQNMINDLQLESSIERPQEIHIYVYPHDARDIDFAKECFYQVFDSNYKLKFLCNRHISSVHYGEDVF